jgi:hypothetical protein
MKNISFRIVIVLSILSGFLSYASGIVITERLKNASVKEQRATTSAFSSKDEVPVYLRGISGQEYNESNDSSQVDGKVSVTFYPVDEKSDNIDTSFFITHNIEYIKSESFLIADVPLDLIPELKSISGVEYADISDPVKPMEIISEGRNAINATKFVLDGVDGEGVKIAVIDIGFRGYAYLQSRGELPRNLITADFSAISSYPNPVPPIDSATGDTHGSACAEIIADIAPSSEMYLLKIGSNDNNSIRLQWALKYCQDNNIKIVNCPIGVSVTPSFISGEGAIDTFIDARLADNSFLSVVAVGNEADNSWFGSFQNSGPGSNFTRFPNGSEFLNVNVPTESDIDLIWDDYGAGNSSYDLILCNHDGSVFGQTHFGGGQVKRVTINNRSNNRFKIKIQQNNDALMLTGRYMRLTFSKSLSSGYIVENPIDINPESSLCMPADARGALTVGAVNVSNYGSGSIAYYSSRGPVRKTWTMKPELVAPTGVTTASLGYKSFAGTSLQQRRMLQVLLLYY